MDNELAMLESCLIVLAVALCVVLMGGAMLLVGRWRR
jgi:hypothetical protein